MISFYDFQYKFKKYSLFNFNDSDDFYNLDFLIKIYEEYKNEMDDDILFAVVFMIARKSNYFTDNDYLNEIKKKAILFDNHYSYFKSDYNILSYFFYPENDIFNNLNNIFIHPNARFSGAFSIEGFPTR